MKKSLRTPLLAFFVCVLVFALLPLQGTAYSMKALSAQTLKNAAKKYAEGNEKAGTPITVRHKNVMYTYVPFTVNGTISSAFPGIMLDSKAKPITKRSLLKELFRYPGFIKEFADNTSGFNKLAGKKVTAFAQYCRLLEIQKIKLDALNRSGNVAGVICQGAKLAFDAVALVKSGTKGLAALIKDLAKGKVQDSIMSYFVPADSRAVLQSTQRAYDHTKTAHTKCTVALAAWNDVRTTTGKATTTQTKYATSKVAEMFYAESASMSNFSKALERINKYPKLVTKIGADDYTAAMTNMTALVQRLGAERKTWTEYSDNANDKNALELWADEQVRRVRPKLSECEAINPSTNSTLYTYTVETGICSSYTDSITSSQLSLRCNQSSAAWRNYLVKPLDVSGQSTVKISADLGLNDHSRFFTECSGVGVKYDDYVSIMVLSSDPRSTLAAECNKTASSADWSKCAVSPIDDAVVASCGVAKCTASQYCDLTVSTGGKSALYLVYHVSDAWLADIEGTMANASVCPAS